MKTSSFRLYTGPGRISIARSAPRRTPAGFRVFSRLAPGKWFNSVPRAEYEHRYRAEILDRLNPNATWDALMLLAGGAEPVLMCYETLHDPEDWCHRRMVAAWFKETIGADVPELVTVARTAAAPEAKGFPDLLDGISERTSSIIPRD